MAVVATGFFDGVHLGHRLVIDTLVSRARERGEKSVVVTFWPHPRTVLQNGARDLRLLTSLSEKEELLRGLGVDEVCVLGFTREFSSLSARDYLGTYVRDRFCGTALLLGYDNRLGRDGLSGEALTGLASDMGIEVIRTGGLQAGEGRTISSTLIRSLLSGGDVEGAAKLLGRPYLLHGVVVAGNRLGRTIGFPTANMQLYEPLKLVPGGGVYLVEVLTLGKVHYGMCNIGFRPTVGGGGALTIETNIFDFDEDIYGLDISLRFMARIRHEQRFPSLEALSLQLAEDRRTCRELLCKNGDKNNIV